MAIDEAHASPESMAESTQRRKLELILAHHWRDTVAASVSVDQASVRILQGQVTKLALESDALLYMLHALSSLHLHIVGAENLTRLVADLGYEANIHQRYFIMSLQKQQRAIANLSSDNTEALAAASIALRAYLFASLQSRPLKPYQPPQEWLHTCRSTARMYKESVRVSEQHSSAAEADDMHAVTHHLGRNKTIREEVDRLDHGGESAIDIKLRRLVDGINETEVAECNSQSAEFFAGSFEALYRIYEPVVRSLHELFSIPDTVEDVQTQRLRKLIVFPVFIGHNFARLVQEGQPRALVILSHYFAILSHYSHLWWVGQSGVREVDAVAEMLQGTAFADKMEWPLQIVSARRGN
mgnify:CR=1 FL=1